MRKESRKLPMAGMPYVIRCYVLQWKHNAFLCEPCKMHNSHYTSIVYREQMCTKCQSEEATVHCKDCGPFVYLCQACTIVIHSDPLFLGNAFHLPQLWTAV